MVSIHSKDLDITICIEETLKLLKKPVINITTNTVLVNSFNTKITNKSDNTSNFDFDGVKLLRLLLNNAKIKKVCR